MTKLRYKKCRLCDNVFTCRSMSHVYCSPKCAINAAQQKSQIKEDKQLKLPFMDGVASNAVAVKKKSASKKTKSVKAERPKSFYVNKLQVLVNRYIRLRDHNEPCISCGKHRTNYHAGHYLSVGGHSELRFHEENIHKQCVYCNVFLSGNLLNYRVGLINKIGLDRVLFLESKHEPNKLTIPELSFLIEKYKEKLIGM